LKQADEYRKNAEECRELAKHALTHKERDELLELAETWERLANDRFAFLSVRPVQEDEKRSES
jgi:hypothetical protein